MGRNRVLDGFSSFFGDLGRARKAANLYEELHGMSDRALKARGLNRDDLPSYAYRTAFGDK
jgi:uncharacterized protein YjiS (DUF1127 family)